ncbi:hypothetical protein FB451DRAFT_1190393 [Mycena latifolia]|nr:hypothetical protein FB451DRAFT_1190393 [Mycena latifolia]
MALSSSTLQFVLLLAVYGYQYQSKCYGTPPSPFLPQVLTVLGCTTEDIPNGHPVTWSPDGSDHPKTKQWLAGRKKHWKSQKICWMNKSANGPPYASSLWAQFLLKFHKIMPILRPVAARAIAAQLCRLLLAAALD